MYYEHPKGLSIVLFVCRRSSEELPSLKPRSSTGLDGVVTGGVATLTEVMGSKVEREYTKFYSKHNKNSRNKESTGARLLPALAETTEFRVK